MQLRILGPLFLAHNGKPVPIDGRRQHTVLAMLVLEHGKVVSVDRLILAIWGEAPPATARAQVQFCVSRLRRTLRGRSTSAIRTVSPGYLLDLGTDTLDLDEYVRVACAGHKDLKAGRIAQAVAQFRAALALWHGPALSNVESALVSHIAEQLDERRISLLEECIAAEAAAGSGDDLVAELTELTWQYPLRERLRLAQMTALHQAGRRAEALEVYRETRRLLIDELGIEPSPELAALHQRLLDDAPEQPAFPPQAADPGVAAPDPDPAPAAPLVPTAAAVPVTPTPTRPAAPSAPPAGTAGLAVPRLLPPTLPVFIGRTKAIDWIAKTLTEAPGGHPSVVPTIALYGRGGVGKSALTIRVAHLLSPLFPDGQLFARLQHEDGPVSASAVLGRFLRVLGVDGDALPADTDGRADLYRHLLGGRRMLVVLDDVDSELQLQPLLPGHGGCAVLLTGRTRLTGIPADWRREVSGLEPEEAAAMLAQSIGSARTAAEAEAVEQICELTDGLPLALRIVGARLAARPHMSIASMVERLRDDTRMLDELEHSDASVRASIQASYQSLSPDAQRLLRRLALLDAPYFPTWVSEPLLQADPRHAEDVLGELSEHHFVSITMESPTGTAMCRFLGASWNFARERLVEEEDPHDRGRALERLTQSKAGRDRAPGRWEAGGARGVLRGLDGKVLIVSRRTLTC